MTPFKVVATDIGCADVADRATGVQVGYVLRNRAGWSAYLSSNPGRRLVFAPDECSNPAYARTLTGPIYASRLRVNAARKVWTAAQRGQERTTDG